MSSLSSSEVNIIIRLLVVMGGVCVATLYEKNSNKQVTGVLVSNPMHTCIVLRETTCRHS